MKTDENPKACVALRPGVCLVCKEAIVPGEVLGQGRRWRIHLRCCCLYHASTPAAGPMANAARRFSRIVRTNISRFQGEVERADGFQALRLGVLLSDYDGSSMSKAFEMQQRDPSMIQRIPGKDLRVGDTLRYLEPHPWVRVTAIRPYTGPLKDTVELLVDTRPGIGFSFCFGDEVEVDRPEVAQIRSIFRNRVSEYLLTVELLASTLRDILPILREHIETDPDKPRKFVLSKAVDRLDEVLTKVELLSEERES